MPIESRQDWEEILLEFPPWMKNLPAAAEHFTHWFVNSKVIRVMAHWEKEHYFLLHTVFHIPINFWLTIQYFDHYLICQALTDAPDT